MSSLRASIERETDMEQKCGRSKVNGNCCTEETFFGGGCSSVCRKGRLELDDEASGGGKGPAQKGPLLASAAAYYYHGLILDEGNTEKSHGMAAASLQASEEFLKESKKACESFSTTPPLSRVVETAPSLPDFMIALKPDDYKLPALDPSWIHEENNQIRNT
ncbi:hypothetical protein KSP40_PGU009780 [Platanthera guangdongensis]|uniref:Late embryogenesis abundant protein n=1 Tax=Platanthera guangdongensis TaxID=2320717 RepID=A0ABR2LM05_9ASPA